MLSISTNFYQITNEDLRTIAHNCTGLEDLNLWNCDKISDEGIQSVAENCKQIVYLNIGGCGKITDNSIEAKFNREYNR